MTARVLPELLAPAGSPEALRAAVAAGADAVYFGASGFNARAGAKNFTDAELCRAVEVCHANGVRVYLTLNTLVYDREMRELIAAAERAYLAGVDALIVADLGVAAAIKRTFPDFELHASTQMSGHSAAAARELAELGFSRMVLARELSREDIFEFTKHSPIEAEVFIHGALCVSHSGQCLFSSMVGGRSGNRGECAQPCRLPYNGGRYLLSLKDNCLAAHIPDLIEAGVASLKIEGRMKGADYVGGVVSIYRRLLDERRAATERELDRLAGIFSRSGFTDGYFCGRIDHDMLGVRTERDKQRTTSHGAGAGTGAAASAEVSAACQKRAPIAPPPRSAHSDEYSPCRPQGRGVAARTAQMHSVSQLTPAARRYFDISFIPLREAAKLTLSAAAGENCGAIGAALPPVIPDSELPGVRAELAAARERGVRDLLVGNIGHLSLAREFDMRPHGDMRLNICNRESAAAYEALGFCDMILSPELTLPRLRDIGGRTQAIVYGRIPLMVTEKCAGRECGSCRGCAEGKNKLIDRRGVAFPVLRQPRHRSLIVNSLPTSMSDKQKQLQEYGLRGRHFIFTVESAAEVDSVIRAFEGGRPIAGDCRRIAQK